jgi:glycosyltransferase involved in cell wall biosynthesis
MKIAIVHEWLVTYGGSEKVVEELLALFPEADIFTLVDFLPSKYRSFLSGKKITTSVIQNLPFARKYYRQYLPIMPYAVEQFDLSGHDLVLSSNHAVAKGVLTGPGQLHISYYHSPMRYAWEMQHQYLNESGLNRGILTWPTRWLLHELRLWDYRTSNGVDYFIANSEFVARRIWKAYRREAKVIYPPVHVERLNVQEEKDNFYLTASRIVSYKRMDLIVDAFNQMPDRRLVVIGEGPGLHNIKKKASQNIEILGYQPDDILHQYMQKARAFIFAALEDFGMVIVEAQACGTPVIAYGQGGALEIIHGLDHGEPSGVFFQEQTAQSIIDAINAFESSGTSINPTNCRVNAERFSAQRFNSDLLHFVEDAWEHFPKSSG